MAGHRGGHDGRAPGVHEVFRGVSDRQRAVGELTTMTRTSFELATAGRVIVGEGRAAELPSVVAGLGSRVFVCTGSRPERHADLVAALPPGTVFPVAGEPTVELARTATAAARNGDADIVVAIGGGSVIDLGKAVAILLGSSGE